MADLPTGFWWKRPMIYKRLKIRYAHYLILWISTRNRRRREPIICPRLELSAVPAWMTRAF